MTMINITRKCSIRCQPAVSHLPTWDTGSFYTVFSPEIGVVCGRCNVMYLSRLWLFSDSFKIMSQPGFPLAKAPGKRARLDLGKLVQH